MEKWIEDARLEMWKNGITITDLAKKIGSERAHVNRILNGRIVPRRSKVCEETVMNAIREMRGAK